NTRKSVVQSEADVSHGVEKPEEKSRQIVARQFRNSATTMWLSFTGQVRAGTVSLLNTASTVRGLGSKASRPADTAGTPSVMPGGTLPSSVNLSRPTPK